MFRPKYLEAYQRGAQILVREAEATDTLGDLAVACVYMQRHVLELALKALIGMLHMVADLDEELARIEKTDLKRAMPPDDERKRSSKEHQLDVLLNDLRNALQREVASGSNLQPLPPELDGLVADLCALEDRQPSRLRYPTLRTKGDPKEAMSFPQRITIPVRELQLRLDAVVLALFGRPHEVPTTLGQELEGMIEGTSDYIDHLDPRPLAPLTD